MVDVIHTALWVSDLEETKAFYIDALGLSHTWDFESDGVTNFYVGSDAGAEIQFKYEPGRGAVEPSGMDHVAVAVDDVDATFEHLRSETDTEVVHEPHANEAADSYVAFLTDPDGYVVELVGELE